MTRFRGACHPPSQGHRPYSVASQVVQARIHERLGEAQGQECLSQVLAPDARCLFQTVQRAQKFTHASRAIRVARRLTHVNIPVDLTIQECLGHIDLLNVPTLEWQPWRKRPGLWYGQQWRRRCPRSPPLTLLGPVNHESGLKSLNGVVRIEFQCEGPQDLRMLAPSGASTSFQAPISSRPRSSTCRASCHRSASSDRLASTMDFGTFHRGWRSAESKIPRPCRHVGRCDGASLPAGVRSAKVLLSLSVGRPCRETGISREVTTRG